MCCFSAVIGFDLCDKFDLKDLEATLKYLQDHEPISESLTTAE